MRRNLCWIIFVLLCAGTARIQACAVFSAPVTYRMPQALIDFDVGPQVLAANRLAHKQFVAASAQARRLVGMSTRA